MKIYSLHIPKTGGRSFRKILEDQYGPENVQFLPRHVLLNKIKDGTITSFFGAEAPIFHCHFMFSEIENNFDSSSDKLITWLRDPVERVISNHRFFIKRLQDEPSTQNEVHLRNLHRRNESLLEYAAMEENRNLMSKYTFGASLNDFFFIGFLESFQKDLNSLGRLLGWNSVYLPHENSNKEFRGTMGRPSEEEISQVRKWNSLDVELYSSALDYMSKKS